MKAKAMIKQFATEITMSAQKKTEKTIAFAKQFDYTNTQLSPLRRIVSEGNERQAPFGVTRLTEYRKIRRVLSR